MVLWDSANAVRAACPYTTQIEPYLFKNLFFGSRDHANQYSSDAQPLVE